MRLQCQENTKSHWPWEACQWLARLSECHASSQGPVKRSAECTGAAGKLLQERHTLRESASLTSLGKEWPGILGVLCCTLFKDLQTSYEYICVSINWTPVHISVHGVLENIQFAHCGGTHFCRGDSMSCSTCTCHKCLIQVCASGGVLYNRLTANVVDGDTVLFAADVVPSDSEGDHLVTFTPKISGTYGLVLLFDGTRQLSGSPFKIRVKTDETMAANCKLYGPGLTRAAAGERTSFSIKGGASLQPGLQENAIQLMLKANQRLNHADVLCIAQLTQ